MNGSFFSIIVKISIILFWGLLESSSTGGTKLKYLDANVTDIAFWNQEEINQKNKMEYHNNRLFRKYIPHTVHTISIRFFCIPFSITSMEPIHVIYSIGIPALFLSSFSKMI